MKILTVKVPGALDARLASLAKRRRATKSAVVREAIEEICRDEGKNIAGSCLDLARDLAGCVEGPKNLSSNKKYLKGYGR